MTTVAQVEQVTRPLLERNADLALVGRLVLIKPVRHLLRGVYIDRISDPIIFQPMWFVNFLFEPGARVTYRWGERVYDKRAARSRFTRRAVLARARIMSAQRQLPVSERRYPRRWGGWVVSDPKIATRMCKVIEQEALPMLRGLQSLDDFVAFTSDRIRFPWTYLGNNHFSEPFVYAAHANFDAAEATCIKLRAEYPRSVAIKEFLRLITTRDRAGLSRLLHDWEADAVQRLKLDKFWAPTPFPIETAS